MSAPAHYQRLNDVSTDQFGGGRLCRYLGIVLSCSASPHIASPSHIDSTMLSFLRGFCTSSPLLKLKTHKGAAKRWKAIANGGVS